MYTTCVIKDCKRATHKHKTLCRAHYQSQRRNSVAGPHQRGCQIDGCPLLHEAKGFCSKHYGKSGPTLKERRLALIDDCIAANEGRAGECVLILCDSGHPSSTWRAKAFKRLHGEYTGRLIQLCSSRLEGCCNPFHVETAARAKQEGLAVPRKQHKHAGSLSDSAVLSIVAKHEAGVSNKALAQEYGCPYGQIGKILNGHTRTDLTGRSSKVKPKLTSQQVLEICARFDAGETQAELAAAFGLKTAQAVANIVSGRSWGKVTGRKRVPSRTNRSRKPR